MKNRNFAVAAPAKQAPKGAKPGEAGPAQGKKEPKPKIVKVPYGKRDAEGDLLQKLSERPADFDRKKHEPLRRKDFDTFANYLDFRAAGMEDAAKQMRQMAADEREGKGKSTKAKQKRLLNLKDKFEQLRKELEAAGVNVDAALAGQAAG